MKLGALAHLNGPCGSEGAYPHDRGDGLGEPVANKQLHVATEIRNEFLTSFPWLAAAAPSRSTSWGIVAAVPTLKWNIARYHTRMAAVALLSATLAGCIMSVEYARRGESLAPRAGKALVFTRIRFFDDRTEYFPWGFPSLTETLSNFDRARHVWLRPLNRQAASWELQPDKDGSIAIWLSPGDYALFGLEGDLSASIGPQSIVALLRVPDGQPVVYAGELVFTMEHREGWSGSYTFGASSVTTGPVAAATEALEARYGRLPGRPAMSAWCVGAKGSDLPQAYDAELVRRARRLLDNCSSASP